MKKTLFPAIAMLRSVAYPTCAKENIQTKTQIARWQMMMNLEQTDDNKAI